MNMNMGYILNAEQLKKKMIKYMHTHLKPFYLVMYKKEYFLNKILYQQVNIFTICR